MNNLFKGKRLLIVAPHEDDELNIAGGMIHSLKSRENIYIAFVTNGDYVYNSKTRQKEALRSIKTMGIKKENVYFMGYSDQPYDSDNHMYMTKGTWKSKKNKTKTYSELNSHPDFSYLINNKQHNEFTKNNLLKDLEKMLLMLKPDVIISCDLDFHPDHIMTSLILEKAIGNILKKYSYTPIVLKTFTYENSYLGYSDFFEMNYKGMFFNLDKKGFLLSNKYYNICDAIIFSVDEKILNRSILKNKFCKSILKHTSQNLCQKIPNIINSNNCYWNRRSDSLTYKAKVKASSGDPCYLTDYLLCDASNILNGNKKIINFDESIWVPKENDRIKSINFTFNKKEKICLLKIYHGLISEKMIKKVKIRYSNNEITVNLEEYTKGHITELTFEDMYTDFVEIQIMDKDIFNGFSEIEMYKNYQNNIIYECSKILLDGRWLKNYYAFANDTVCTIDKYVYNISLNDTIISIENAKNVMFDECSNKITIGKKSTGTIQLIHKCTNEILDTVYINKNRKIEQIRIFFNKNIILPMCVFIQKIYRKIFIK